MAKLTDERKLIRLYMPLLEEYLISTFIVQDLEQILGRNGIQRVSTAEEASFKSGVHELLELLMNSEQPGWFSAFINALNENDYQMMARHLVQRPDVKDPETFTEFLSKFLEQLINEVDSQDLLPSLLESETILKKDEADIRTESAEEGIKSAMFLLLLRLPQQKRFWVRDFITALRLKEKESYQTLAHTIEAGINDEEEKSPGIMKNSEEKTLVKNTIDDGENPNLSDVLMSDFNASPESLVNFSAFSKEKNAVEKIIWTSSDLGDDSQETQHPTSEEIQTEPLELRSYQRELAEPAIDDKNVIIVAPTGSGKTHVALYITENHLKVDGGTKVVFLVPTTELVSQQTRMYRTYLSRFSVCGLSGEVQGNLKVPLSSLIEKYNIIVMTPQILLNALRKNDIQSLKVFTLMVFDECHHATKEHPYNNIMAVYLDEKYLEDRDYLLPQIVGLTASVGVGSARDLDKAREHILSLCANLDAVDGISIVVKHEEELKKFVNKPKEDKIETRGRHEDPFRKIVSDMMKDIEDQMRKLIARNRVGLGELSEVPSSKGCDQYTQWVSRLKKGIIKFPVQDVRTSLYACHKHLETYNTALMINEDCRTIDALSYLLKEFKPIESEHKDDNDNWLEALFNEKLDELTRVSKDPRYDNPKLGKLAKLIVDKYKTKPDMRAIIFCKTREMTMALQEWIKETPELVILNPNRLVGANAPAEKGGMTQHKQEDVLAYFKGGIHKVIIATSVAEEGLDVSKCNLVIRYEYVTNEIAMVQARGRGRAEDSDYIVMGDHRRGAIQKEELNKIRECMMNKAILTVKQMPHEKRENEIVKIQKEAIIERKMNEVGKRLKAKSRPRESPDIWELRCEKCDEIGCLATDIRVFNNTHHMVLDDAFVDRVVIERHPNPKNIDDMVMTDKIFCKKCHTSWGIRVIFKGVKFCLIKISSFVIINVIRHSRDTYKKWKNAPFYVNDLTAEEMRDYSKNLTTREH